MIKLLRRENAISTLFIVPKKENGFQSPFYHLKNP